MRFHHTMSRLGLFASVALSGLAAAPALAQCDGQFITGNGVPGISGDDGVIQAWDPDGAGPTPELLFTGGNYKLAHTTIVNSFASWEPLFNQQNPVGIWRNVSGGVTFLGDPGFVLTTLPIGTDLLVGGFFDAANVAPNVVNATNVAKYDGLTGTWVPYGTGVPGPVFASTIFNGQIFIGGRWRLNVSGVEGDSIARWDGSRWRPLGAGFSIPDPADDPPSTPPLTLPGTVNALAVYNNRLFAGGIWDFSGRDPMTGQPIPNPDFCRWNPQTNSWIQMLQGDLTAPFPYTPGIYAMRVYGNLLYFGGIWDNIGNSFATSNGFSQVLQNEQPLAQVLPVDAGVNKFLDASKVFTMTQVGQELLVGGDFEWAGTLFPTYAFNMVRWNGTRYLAVADGGSDGRVFSMTTFRGQLAAMGDLEVVNGQRVRGISWYNGNIWTRAGLGMDAPIFALDKYNGQVVAGGPFGRMSTDVMAQGVAFYNGTAWQQVGNGLANGPRITEILPPPATYPNRPLTPAIVNDLTTHDGDLIAVGEFTRSGPNDGFANIAAWDGITWSPVGQVDGPVFGAASYRGELFIAGDLINYGNIARYDGFGGYFATTFGTDGPGYTLTVHNDQLVAGGFFMFAGGVDSGPIAKWNYDTETWTRISPTQTVFTPPPFDPPIPTGWCNVVTVIDGDLYAGGNWIDINGNANLRKFARFNSTTNRWVVVGPNGTGPNFDVWSIKKVGDSIYVGGEGDSNIMAFDGTTWRIVDGGTDGTVYGIEEINGRVVMGGNFLTASNEASAYFTSYTRDANVAITTPPASQTVCQNGSVTFSVVATGSGTLTYQWRRNNVNINGATSASFTINPVGTGDAGNYTCLVSNGCSSSTSTAAVLTVTAAPGITTQPVNRTLCEGGTISLSVTATGANLSYQWRRNSVNINGANAASLSISNATVANAGSYDVVVTNTCGSITSNASTVTVNQAISIAQQPQGATLCGTPLNLSVTAGGTITGYQWRRNNVNINGATSATYTVANPTAADSGSYTVVISGPCGNVTSNAAVVTASTPVSITQQPQSAFGCLGGSVTLTVTATGTTPAYQWRKDGINIQGATSASYTINPVTAGAAGVYSVVVSNGCNSVTSGNATVSVCGADFNCDGFVDFFDYTDFVDAFQGGGPGGDYNGDGFIDFFDYTDFVDAFQAGC
jgi:hypothetical protein